MPATVIIGGQWGDEGKAKIVDYLMSDHDVVIRYQGGANAGHTVVTEAGRFAFHQVPSGVLYPHVTGILGNGMVVDPFAFLDELGALLSRGIDFEGRLFISSAAHAVLPFHRVLDNLYEADLMDENIGSTGKGIGPAYSDKFSRRGMRMGDFTLDKADLFELVRYHVEQGNKFLEMFKAPPLSSHKVATDLVNIRDLISNLIADTQEAVYQMKSEGKRILLEGAQGALLDIDHGTYPFVTSSSCSVGGALTGSGLNVGDIGRILGIFKAYVTRVGNGPFPTEIEGEEGERLREKGKEYGTTTGRPRRCGWFDLVAADYSVRLNGFTDIVITKLDVISGLPSVKICVAYEVDGRKLTSFPQNSFLLRKCKPVYEEFPGWSDEELGGGSYEELPENARRYIEILEERLGVKVSFISTGPLRKQTIIREAAYSFDR
ncbi:MAG: adenylosuccinate synthase [Candidatus Krumholzibacteria bacterium]|nr:adenylosuccinate synthase [Candidatus Krumholzibacteria bacterium]